MRRTFAPETAFFDERRWPALSEAEVKLHALIVPDHKRSAIDPREFMDLYGGPAVTRDLKRVETFEAGFKGSDPENASHRTRGELFEAIVSDQVESSDWLGGNAHMIVPSRYDDIVNGIDGVVEFEEESGRAHLAIGVDVTKGTESIHDKFSLIRYSINKGELSKAKYFKTEDYRGELNMVPRVIVGAGQKVTNEVAELLLEFKQMQKRPAVAREKQTGTRVMQENIAEFRGIRDSLANHILQFIILYEMRMQLEAFAKYAERVDRTALASAYRKRLDIVKRVLQDKLRDADTDKIESAIEQDSVYKMIKERTATFLK